MLRIVLFLILFVIVARVFWRVVDNVIEAATGRPPGARGGGGVPQQGVPMARDPICGTFVVPDHALSITDGRSRMYFCSKACLDAYRKRAGRTA